MALPQAVPPGITVFRLDLSAPLCRADWALLSEDERQRAMRFHHHADRVRSVATRAALRRLLGARLCCGAGTLRFASGPFGKPALRDGDVVAFNVSHSGSVALITLSDAGAVGVDVERRDPALDLGSLAPAVFSQAEWCTQDRIDFFDTWVAKEAVVKALGVGIGDGLESFSVSQGGTGYLVRHARQDWRAIQGLAVGRPARLCGRAGMGPNCE